MSLLPLLLLLSQPSPPLLLALLPQLPLALALLLLLLVSCDDSGVSHGALRASTNARAAPIDSAGGQPAAAFDDGQILRRMGVTAAELLWRPPHF